MVYLLRTDSYISGLVGANMLRQKLMVFYGFVIKQASIAAKSLEQSPVVHPQLEASLRLQYLG